MLAKETLDFAHEVLHDMNEDPRLRNMNAIVFLQYKDKNPKAHYHPPSFQEFKTLVDFCLSDMVKFGFDSCSSAMFMKAVADREDAEKLIQSVDNCESTLFSFYIDVDGNGYPCSFLQGQTEEWKEGIDILSIEDYIKDVWFNPRVIQYRKTLLNSSKNCNCKYSGMCRSCFVYDVNDCKDR
jgi:MoaA/NifB/PqqE/SkfB family radical SAM enzyme